MNKIGWAACALSAVLPLAMLAETDVCGNEIRSYVEDGVTKTYKFISSGSEKKLTLRPTFKCFSIIPESLLYYELEDLDHPQLIRIQLVHPQRWSCNHP